MECMEIGPVQGLYDLERRIASSQRLELQEVPHNNCNCISSAIRYSVKSFPREIKPIAPCYALSLPDDYNSSYHPSALYIEPVNIYGNHEAPTCMDPSQIQLPIFSKSGRCFLVIHFLELRVVLKRARQFFF